MIETLAPALRLPGDYGPWRRWEERRRTRFICDLQKLQSSHHSFRFRSVAAVSLKVQ